MLRKERENEIIVGVDGEKYRIIEYRDCESVTIERLTDGRVYTNRRYSDLRRGIVHEQRYMIEETVRHNKIGETKVANNGKRMTIIEYRDAWDIDIMFEDGTIIRHKNYRNFKNGSIGDKAREYKGINRTEEKQKKQEEKERRNREKREGREKIRIVNRIGQKSKHKNGLTMEIIAYRGALDIDVKFSDGVIRERVQYASFKQGTVKHESRTEERQSQ